MVPLSTHNICFHSPIYENYPSIFSYRLINKILLSTHLTPFFSSSSETLPSVNMNTCFGCSKGQSNWDSFYENQNMLLFMNKKGSAVAQRQSTWLETEGPRVRASPASLRCGPWARHIYPSLVLVQPRKTRPCLSERLLMGRKESNQTNKQIMNKKVTHL